MLISCNGYAAASENAFSQQEVTVKGSTISTKETNWAHEGSS